MGRVHEAGYSERNQNMVADQFRGISIDQKHLGLFLVPLQGQRHRHRREGNGNHRNDDGRRRRRALQRIDDKIEFRLRHFCLGVHGTQERRR